MTSILLLCLLIKKHLSTFVTPALNTESQNANLGILGVYNCVFFAESIFAGTQWFWMDSLWRTGGILRFWKKIIFMKLHNSSVHMSGILPYAISVQNEEYHHRIGPNPIFFKDSSVEMFQLKKKVLFLTFSYLLLFSQNWTVSAKLYFCYLYNRKSLKSQIWNARLCSPHCSGIQQIWKL